MVYNETKEALQALEKGETEKTIEILIKIIQLEEEILEEEKAIAQKMSDLKLPEFLEPLDLDKKPLNWEEDYVLGKVSKLMEVGLMLLKKEITDFGLAKVQEIINKLMQEKIISDKTSEYRTAQLISVVLNNKVPVSEELASLGKPDREELDSFPFFVTLAEIFGIRNRMNININDFHLAENYQKYFTSKNKLERFEVCLFGLWFPKITADRDHMYRGIVLSRYIRDIIQGKKIIILTGYQDYFKEPTYDGYEDKPSKVIILKEHPSNYTVYWILKYALKNFGGNYADVIAPLLEEDKEILIEQINKQDCNLFKEFTIAEVGGCGTNEYLSKLFGEYKDISGDGYQKVDEENLVLLSSYKRFFKHKYDFTTSTRTFDAGSRGGNKELEDKSFQELFCVFANITKNGGFSIHFGEPIPGILERKELWNFVGFKLVDYFKDYLFVFQKIDDREISEEEFNEWLKNNPPKRRF